MRRFYSLLCALAACTLLMYGCGDDTTAVSGEPDMDPVTDTGDMDPGEDVDEDADEDPVESDVTEDPTEPDADIPDIPDPEGGCEDCTDDQVCRGSVCVDEQPDYATEVAERDASYWWSIQLPRLLEEPEDCCFDFDDDPEPDDGLGVVLGLLGSFLEDTDVQALLDEAIVDGSVVLLNDWTTWPEGDGEAAFGINLGDLEEDDDGPVEDFETVRAVGDGTYTISGESFDEYGAQVQFNNGEVDDGTLTSGPSTFVLTIAIPGFFEEPLALTLDLAQIQADVTEETTGIFTEDEMRAGEDGDFFVGGGQMGGVVRAEQILTLLDDTLADCECGDIDPDEPIVEYVYNHNTGTMDVSCNPENNGSGNGDDIPACGDADGDICGNIGTVCPALAIIGRALDVDILACEEVGGDTGECGPGADNPCECAIGRDGIRDSLSVGLRFAWTGADVTGVTPTE